MKSSNILRQESLRASSTLIALVMVFFILSGCTTTAQLQSEPVASPIRVDGNLQEWSNALNPVKGANMSLGIRNDDRFVYVAVMTTDEMLARQIMFSGMTLWFNPSSDQSKYVGVRFPVGRGLIRLDGQASPPEGPGNVDPFGDIEIINEDGVGRRLPVNAVPGIASMARMELGAFRYELRIPIESGNGFDYGIDLIGAGGFGFGIETGVMAPPGSDNTNAAAGGRSGGRGGRGGRGGGARGGTGGQRGGPEPVNVWCVVTLAAGGSS